MKYLTLLVILLTGCSEKYDYDSGVCREYRTEITALENCLSDDRCLMTGTEMRRLERDRSFVSRLCKEPNER